MKRNAGVVIALLVCVVVVHGQERRDGNWWLQIDRQAQLGYVLGLMDGAVNLSPHADRFVTEPKPFGQGVIADALHVPPILEFMHGVTNGQLADGMTQFYGDASNRLIPTSYAAWIALRKIAGHKQADIDAEVERLRSAARVP